MTQKRNTDDTDLTV